MHPKDIDHTHIECSYNRHNQYLNANVWNTEKRDTKQNRDLVWCWLMLHTGIWNIPMKSCTYPWSLRLPPVQFTRVMVASLVSVPATRAVYRSFRPQCRAGSIWRCRFRRSCCVEWFSRWLVLRLLPLPCHAVCHTFVLVRAALDRTFMRRIQRCQLFSFASVFCQSSFCNDWYWTLISDMCFMVKLSF